VREPRPPGADADAEPAGVPERRDEHQRHHPDLQVRGLSRMWLSRLLVSSAIGVRMLGLAYFRVNIPNLVFQFSISLISMFLALSTTLHVTSLSAP
jgi:hypothetical protein